MDSLKVKGLQGNAVPDRPSRLQSYHTGKNSSVASAQTQELKTKSRFQSQPVPLLQARRKGAVPVRMPAVGLAYEPVNEKPQNARLHQYMQGKLASHIPVTKKTVTLDLEDQYDSDNS